MSLKTETALAAIFRHCDEVADGKRPPRTEQEGKEAARFWLGVKGGVKGYAKPNDQADPRRPDQ